MDLATQAFTLTYQDDNRCIRGIVTRPADMDHELPGVLVLHGFKGFLKWGFFPDLQERIARAGFISIAFNMSGSGVGEDLESFTDDEGFFASTPSRDVEDVACVRSFFQANDLGVDQSRLAIFGHSRGGGTAILHAEESGDYRAVVTWASVAKTIRYPEETLADWRAKGVAEILNARTGKVHRVGVGWLEDAEKNAEELDITAACARLEAPTLFVHGTSDLSVPFYEGETLAAAAQDGRLVPIEGAGHTLGALHPYEGPTPALEEAMGETLGFLAGRLT